VYQLLIDANDRFADNVGEDRVAAAAHCIVDTK